MRRLRLWAVVLTVGCAGGHRSSTLDAPIVRPSLVPAKPGSGGALVGLVCREGRPRFLAGAVRRDREWTTAPADVRAALGRGDVRELAVMGFLGKRAGRFTMMGPTADPAPTAIGGYAGASPCADEPTASECLAASGGCGLATGIAGLEEAPRPPARGGCAVGGHLVVDLDGDGLREAFAVAELAAGLEEVGAAPAVAGECVARFAGSLGDGVDLLGVADLDLDGRMEVAVGARATRKVAIYTAGETPARLDRIAWLTLP